jgi:hypothetical protein
MSAFALARLAKVTGDRDVAYTALYQRLAEGALFPVSRQDVVAAERVVVATRFGGSYAAYRAALGRARANGAIARGVIGDELRKATIRFRLKVAYPTGSDVADYYSSSGGVMTREIAVSPAPWWLNGRKRGIAVAPTAPAEIFELPAGRRVTVRTMTARYKIKALGPARPLAAVSLQAARPALVAGLRDIAREDRYQRWTVRRQGQAQRGLACARDELPEEAPVDLAEYLPFLAAEG